MGKKTKRTLYKEKLDLDTEYFKIVKITIGVVCVLLFTYLITAIASGEIKLGQKDKNITQEVNIQYEEIIAGQILNRKHDEYYVLLFNFTDIFASYYLSLKDAYIRKDNALPFYIVDLEKYSNQNVITEKENEVMTNISDINRLKVMNPTILRVKNHKVIESIKGRESILKFFEK